MPWRSTSVMEERIRFVILASRGKSTVTELCREFQISRQTGYRWLNRYHESGSVESLRDRSRRPHSSPNRTADAIEDQVISVRQRYGWGARKLHHLLLHDGQEVAVSTINNILKRHGLSRKPGRGHAAVKRFERARPNELWQMDFKGDSAVDSGRCYPLSLLDDHSRYCLGVYALPAQTTELVKAGMIKTFQRYGLPEAILMDHGSPWWSTTNVRGLTRLSVWLIKQDIKLIWSGIAHPQTQGKIERFHRTINEATSFHGRPKSIAGWQCLLERFSHEYNHVRPHEALGMAPPSSRYRPSTRRYRTTPRAWNYPEGAIVKRLNTQGCLEYRHSRYFVSEALAGERVQIETIKDKLLIKYRDMYVREIESETRRTRAIYADNRKQKV